MRSSSKAAFLLVQSLTVARVPLAVAFAVVLPGAAGDPARLAGCLGLLLAQELSDLLDGHLARRLGVVSRWGQLLDPFVDSVSRLIVYWALAASELTLAILPLVMALRDVTVAYARLWASAHGGSVSARLSGKIKAWVQGLGAMFLAAAPLHAPWTGGGSAAAASWLVLGVTAASAAEYVYSAITAATSSSRSSPSGRPVAQVTANSTVNDAASAAADGRTPGASGDGT